MGRKLPGAPPQWYFIDTLTRALAARISAASLKSLYCRHYQRPKCRLRATLDCKQRRSFHSALDRNGDSCRKRDLATRLGFSDDPEALTLFRQQTTRAPHRPSRESRHNMTTSEPKRGTSRVAITIAAFSKSLDSSPIRIQVNVPLEIRQKLTGHASQDMNKQYTHLEI